MYCVPKFCLILCTIPLIKATSLKIDGLINFGENWSYEYRILRSGAEHSHHQNDLNKAVRQTDEEKLRILEDRLRKEAAEHRKEVLQKDVETDKHHKRQKDEGTTKSAIQTTEHVEKHKTKATFSDESSSSDNDSAKQKKPPTAFIYETTKKTMKVLRFLSKEQDHSETQESTDSRDSSLNSASWTDKTRHATEDDATSSSHDSNISILNHYVNPRTPRELSSKTLESNLNKTIESFSSMFNKTVPTSTRVTTVRTANIYINPHKVKDDAKITEFTNHLYKQTLRVFDAVKQKTNQDHLKVQVDRLAKSYEDKFKEFLRDTSSQKIKTRLGTQKVILNTIDMSNRILKRLMNFMVGDLDKKGVLRYNVASANIFQKAIETEQKLQLVHACKKFGICRSGPGFSGFLTDMLTILLNSNNKKFKQSLDAFTEVMKNKDYSNLLEPHTEKKLKKIIDIVEKQSVMNLKGIAIISKNTLTDRNKPMIVNNLRARQPLVNSTQAVFEIIDLMDENIPKTEENALEWKIMKKNFEECTAGKRIDVLEIMRAPVKHVEAQFKSLDEDTQTTVSKKMDMVLSSFD